MVKTKQNKRIILTLFLLIVFVQPFTYLFPPEEGGFLNSFSPLLPTPVSASEEENIDSWNVHPESGRWNTTLDDAIEDRVVDSQFEILTIQNETSGRSGYEMNRGTTKTDGKFEWRMKSDGSGNKTEFFRDQIGDEIDYTEGDLETESFFSGDSGGPTVSNGILTYTTTGGDPFFGFGKPTNNSLDIPTDVYGIFELKFMADGDDGNNILIQWFNPSGDFIAFTNIGGIIVNTWQTITFDISGNPNWVGLIGGFRFDIPQAASIGIKISVDFVKLIGNYDFATHLEGVITNDTDTWDWEEGDDEDFTALSDSSSVSEGSIILINAGDSTAELLTPIVSINSDNFFNWTFRVKTNISVTIFLDDRNGNTVGGSISITTTDTFLTFSRVLSADADWTGLEEGLRFFIVHSSSINISFDYSLLLGEFNPSDSVIGLMDSQGTPLLNISTRFLGNNTARFEFELLDDTGELSYHFYSPYFTDLNQFIIGKVTFDVLRSKLEVTITAENNSRIDKITFPNEFTIDSGLTPSLFSNKIAPHVFVSTHTIDHSWQSLFLDWIKTDYKEREWTQTEIPTDTDWIADNWDYARVQETITAPGNDAQSSWELVVVGLDSLSGTLFINTTDNDVFVSGGVSDRTSTSLEVFGVDADDGGRHRLLRVSIGYQEIAPNTMRLDPSIAIGGDTVYARDFNFGSNYDEVAPKWFFSFTMAEDRTSYSLKAKFFPKVNEEENFVDIVANGTVFGVVDDPSQEFVIVTNYDVDALTGNIEWVAVFEDFGFTERDIFADIAKAVVEPLGNFFQQIFVNLFKFLAGIFRLVGDVIGLAVLTMQTAIGAAILTMQGALETAIGLVTTAIGTLQTALETAIGLVTTAVEAVTSALGDLIVEIQGLAEDVATAVWTGIGDALDFITEAVEALAAGIWVAILAVGEDLADLVIEILDFVFALAGDILAALWIFITEAFFFLWDLVGAPDVLAIFDALLVGFIQFITGIPQFIVDVAAFGVAIGSLLVTIGFIWIFILPILFASSAGECFEKIIDHAVLDLTGGASFLGVRIPFPVVLPWTGLLVFTFLTDTVFFGFF